MHAYRDAIRRSAGAYVLYPGDHHQIPFTEHHEVLPSLGAFVLRPAEHETLGTSQLEQFLRDVLDHVADQATQHERSRFWRTVAYRGTPLRSAQIAGCRVLGGRRPMHSSCAATCEASLMPRGSIAAGYTTCGRVIGEELFALDSDVLQASDLLLYGRDIAPTLWSRVGTWFVQSREQLLALDYPTPGWEGVPLLPDRASRR